MAKKGFVDVLVCLLYGDSGKGKVIDYLAPAYDIIVRFNGGPNAGHTIEVAGKKAVTHVVPSGILYKGIINIIGPGTVIDVVKLTKEADDIKKQFKITDIRKRLILTKEMSLIHPISKYYEEFLAGRKNLGTTKNAIGPTYADRANRIAMIGDWINDPKFLKQQYEEIENIYTAQLKSAGYDIVSKKKTLADEKLAWFKAVNYIRKNFDIVCSGVYINDALAKGKKILAEGAQGSLLDILHGNYPYTSSSNSVSGAVAANLGFDPKLIREVFGIFKAYTTRVGEGPFLTEFNDSLSKTIRERGFEFGATTGRPRKIGWADLPALQFTAKINGITQLVMTKGDILADLPVKVGVGYTNKAGKDINFEPGILFAKNAKPKYKTFKSWGDITKAKTYAGLDVNFKNYVQFFAKSLGIPVTHVGTGAGRESILKVR